MKQIPSQISKPEKRAIFLFALAISLFVGILFLEEAVYRYREAVLDQELATLGINFSHDDFGRKSPAGLLLLFPLITIALIRPGRFRISTGLTILFIGIFLVGAYLRIEKAREVGFIRPVYDTFDIWDLLFGFSGLVMLAWQISILRRITRSDAHYLERDP